MKTFHSQFDTYTETHRLVMSFGLFHFSTLDEMLKMDRDSEKSGERREKRPEIQSIKKKNVYTQDILVGGFLLKIHN